MKKILINNVQSQYNALPVFMHELREGFAEKGIEVLECKTITDDLIHDMKEKPEAIISFNGSCGDWAMQGCLSDYEEIPVYSYLVDHPYYHASRLQALNKNHHVFCVDENHVDYVKRYYPNIKSCSMIAHGGSEGAHIVPYKDREIPMFFSGTYVPSTQNLQNIEVQLQEESQEVKDLIYVTIELMKKHHCTMEAAVKVILDDIGLDEKELLPVICNAYSNVDSYIRGYYREMIINTIAENGYAIHLYGKGWNQLKTAEKKNVFIHAEIDYKQNIELMGNSKIVLNVMPWFKRGSHERVVCSMLNSAVCITDTSEWLEKSFRQFQEISMFSLQDMEGMLQAIELLQKDESWAEYIAENARKKALQEHTWKHRANQMIERILEQP